MSFPDSGAERKTSVMCQEELQALPVYLYSYICDGTNEKLCFDFFFCLRVVHILIIMPYLKI
jgi:hypothetical protein